ncbi:hypothetical protein FKP32DRAFT_127762 [Trametes sanguinea]|nr:hypothetical protein FKP32DRAFT_127762 [Trametes sanguinea]
MGPIRRALQFDSSPFGRFDITALVWGQAAPTCKPICHRMGYGPWSAQRQRRRGSGRWTRARRRTEVLRNTDLSCRAARDSPPSRHRRGRRGEWSVADFSYISGCLGSQLDPLAADAKSDVASTSWCPFCLHANFLWGVAAYDSPSGSSRRRNLRPIPRSPSMSTAALCIIFSIEKALRCAQIFSSC